MRLHVECAGRRYVGALAWADRPVPDGWRAGDQLSRDQATTFTYGFLSNSREPIGITPIRAFRSKWAIATVPPRHRSRGREPEAYDREHVVVLSDWTFLHPHGGRKAQAEEAYFNRQKQTLTDGTSDACGTHIMGQDAHGPGRHSDVNGSTYGS